MDDPAPTVYPSAPPAVWPPAQVGDYRLGRLLGEGGMGAVFAAEDIHLGRRAAVKLMKPTAHADTDARARFLREARLMASVNHDHVVQVFAVGGQDAVPFIAMERLHGGTLDARLKEHGAIPYASAVVLARQTAEALAAAHAKGLVHRDVKPSNVWLEANDDGSFRRVKLLDFGLTRPVEAGAEALTSTGAIVGTPAYMSPEQAHGKPVDARTDLFSLGVVLYEMLTGRKPFGGESQLAILFAITSTPHESASSVNPAVPEPIAGLVDRLLAKVPDGRPPSAKAVADELRKLAKSVRAGSKEVKLEVVTAPAPVAVETPTPIIQPLVGVSAEEPKRSRRWLLAVGSAVPVVGVGGYLAFGRRLTDVCTTTTGPLAVSLRATSKERTDVLAPAVGRVVVTERAGGAGPAAEVVRATGSGFVVSQHGHVLTTKQVVSLTGTRPPDGRTYQLWIELGKGQLEVQVVHTSLRSDFVVLKINDPRVRLTGWLALANTPATRLPTADVTALGYPLAVTDRAGKANQPGDLTAPLISQDGQIRPPGKVRPAGFEEHELVWHSAVRSSVMDGGPLVGRDGTVVGILSSVRAASAISNTNGSALTLERLRNEIDQHCPGVTWRTPTFN